MPTLPRLPLLPDVLRRIELPADLDAVTTVGEEADPGAGGMTRDGVERIWKAALDLYRSGVHPAVQVCVRREGAGRARPRDRPRARQRPGRHRRRREGAGDAGDAVLHLLGVEGDDRVRRPHARRARRDRHRRTRSPSTSPSTTATARTRSRSATCSPTAPACPTCRARRSTSTGWATASSCCEILCDAKPFAKPGRTLAYHAVSGGFILGEVVHRVTGKDIRQVLAEEILDPLGFRWTNYGVAAEDLDDGRPRLRHRPAAAAAALEPADARARAAARRGRRARQRPALPDRRSSRRRTWSRPRTSSRASSRSCAPAASSTACG